MYPWRVEHAATLEAVNGLRLLVHRFRDPAAARSGLTVLCVHGFADAGATWDLVAERLVVAGHEVVAPDLRGFGGSDSVPAGGYYHFPDYVADVALLVDRLAPERLAVVGHSMGGTVSCIYAGAHPERVARLALLEGIGPVAAEPELAIDRMNAWLRDLRKGAWVHKPLASLDDALERLAVNHPRVDKDVLASRARLLTRTDPEGALVWAYDPLHRTRSPTPFNIHTFGAFVRNVACPTLFVGGGAAGWHPPDEAERLGWFRDVKSFDLPDAGHMMHWTAPDALAARLLEHFG